jgi:hypothetical protein
VIFSVSPDEPSHKLKRNLTLEEKKIQRKEMFRFSNDKLTDEIEELLDELFKVDLDSKG